MVGRGDMNFIQDRLEQVRDNEYKSMQCIDKNAQTLVCAECQRRGESDGSYQGLQERSTLET